jgi:hypothetical protein
MRRHRSRTPRRALGAADASHAASLEAALLRATENLDLAERAYFRGRCVSAGQAIDQVYGYMGKVEAHLEAISPQFSIADYLPTAGDLSVRLRKLDEQFESKCIRLSPVGASKKGWAP